MSLPLILRRTFPSTLLAILLCGCVALPFQRRESQEFGPPSGLATVATGSVLLRGSVMEYLPGGGVAPLPGVQVRSSAGGSGMSDASGNFQLQVAGGRSQVISVTKPGYIFDQHSFTVTPRYDDESRHRIYGSKRGVRRTAQPSPTATAVTPSFVGQQMGVINGRLVFAPDLAGDRNATSDNRIIVRDPQNRRTVRTLPVQWDGEFRLSAPVGTVYLIESDSKEGIRFIPASQTVTVKESPSTVEIVVRRSGTP